MAGSAKNDGRFSSLINGLTIKLQQEYYRRPLDAAEETGGQKNVAPAYLVAADFHSTLR